MIIMVTTATSPGGVWRHIIDSALALHRRGRQVRVAVPPMATALRTQLAELGLNVHEGRRFPAGAVCHFHAADTYDRALLCRMIDARWAGCAVVVTEHLPRTDASDSSLTDDSHRLVAWFAKTLFKTVQFGIAAATVAVSDSSARFLALRYGRNAQEIDVVRNGVGHPDDAGTWPLGHAPAVVGAAGSMLRQKGFDALLHAVAVSRGDWQLLLAGAGPHLDAHRDLARSLGVEDRVTFFGWQDTARSVFRACRVVAVPSRWEAAPYVVLEAMSEGRPVVATRFDGIDEVVVDGSTGLLVPVDDHVRLAAALDDLIADPERCAAMGAAGRERLDELSELSVESMVDGLLAVYDRIADGVGDRATEAS